MPVHGDKSSFHEWLGRVAFLSEQFQQAIPFLKKALLLDQKRPLALKMLGLACFQLGNFSAAASAFQDFLGSHAADMQVENCLGIALVQTGLTEQGVEVLAQCAEKNPKNTALLTNLGDTQKIMGNRQEANRWYRQALQAEPHYGQAHSGLISLTKYQEIDHPDLIKAQDAINQEGLSDHDKASLHFALGKAYDDCQAFDRAFEHFQQGNNLRKKTAKPFNLKVYTSYFSQIKDQFNPEFLAEHNIIGSNSQRPVFIVGMYRSGTSLMEQIIASHREVFGAGELLWLSQTAAQLSQRYNLGSSHYPKSIAKLTTAMAKELADEFETELIRLAGSKDYKRVSDKMPHNYLYLGLIAILFPKARIIHCRRQPLDSCLSNYFQDFTTNLSYTNDLADLGHYYQLYEQLMNHWRKNLNLRMCEVDYEKLVTDPEGESRRVIEFLDLEWDASCLQPHKKQRSVNTASHWQVRQQIHTKSKQRWQHYAAHLQPLTRVLHDK